MKKVIKQAVLGSALSLCLWGLPASAAVTFVGNDIATGSSWRTPGVAKANDVDGDNVYGSAGYFLPSAKLIGIRNPLLTGTNVITPDPQGVTALPSYITDLEFTDAETGSSWGGEFGDDGVNDVVPGSSGFTGAGIMPRLAGTNVLNLKLKRSASPAFRLTLIFGNNPNALTFFETSPSAAGTTHIPNLDDPLGMDVTINDGSGAVSNLSGDSSLASQTAGYTTYQSWDIPAGSSDISITIDLTGTTNTIPRLSGLAFDSLPVTLPTVLIPPVGGTFYAGNPVSLSVNGGGTGIGYQWLKNSNNIPGEISDTFTILNSTTNDSGNYQVLITNSVGSVTSIVASVTVLSPPVTVIYSDTLGGAAGVLNGRVPDTTGAGPWLAGTNWITDGSEASANGSGNALLPFVPQAGRVYTLTADIENFDLGVNQNWPALGFANGTSVNTQWHVANNPVGWFLARGDGTGQFNQAFMGPSTSNPINFSYSPTTLTHYQIILDTTPASPGNWTVTMLANGTIYVPATAFGGSGPTISKVGIGDNSNGSTSHVQNFVLSQQVPFAAPFVTTQPVGGTNFVGENKALTVAVGGSDPLTYQWQKNSNNIANATNLVLTLTNLQTSDSASYRVIVTNPLGSTNSVGAALLVITPVVGTIYKDNFSYVTNLNGKYPDTTGDHTWVANSLWSADGAEAAISSSNTSANAFLPFVPQPGNVYTLSATMDCTGGTDWLALGFANGSNINGQWQTVNNPVGWWLVRPDFNPLSNVNPQQNVGWAGPGAANGVNTTTNTGPHNYAVILDTRPASPSAWTFTFQMDSNNLVGPTAFGGSGPTISTVGFGNLNSATGMVQNFTLTVAASSGSAPVVLTQPVSGSFVVGSQLTLSAYLGGSTPFTYQWQKNSNNIPGATLGQFTLNNLSASDAAYYRVLVTNSVGNTVSSNALVLVAPVTTPAVQITVDAGNVLPSIPVNTNNDLVIFSLASVNPAASGNNFTGLIMRNGTTGTAAENTTQNPANVFNSGTYDFIFDTSVNTNGYDISSVVTYSGWNDRDGQDHTIYYRLTGSSFFTVLTNVSRVSDATAGSVRIAVTNATGGTIVSGVDAIRIVVNQTFFVYREIEVHGTPTVAAVVVPVPTLNIARQGGSVVLSWPVSATGYNLFGTSALTNSKLSWPAVGGSPTVANGTNQVTIPVTNSIQFYLLHN
jgi:hypothetical protein